MKKLFLVLLFFPFAKNLTGQSAWTEKRNQDGIKISTRPSQLSKFSDILVEADFQGNANQLLAILLNVENYPQWAYATKSASVVKKNSPDDLIYYSEINVPWPSTNRDLYAHCRLIRNPDAHSFKMTAIGIKDYQPAKNNIVRIPLSIGTWEVTTLPNNKIHVVYLLQFDPGGAVPAWLLELFSTKGPYETFANLKKRMELLNKS